MTGFSKNSKTILLSIAVGLAAALFFAACKKPPKARTPAPVQTAAAAQTGTPAQPAAKAAKLYRCPMHPTFTSGKPGSCGICGMDLVPVEEEAAPAPAQAAQPTASSTPAPEPKKKIMYRSTMMPNEVSDKPGKDSMGMDMVPFKVEEPAPPQPTAPPKKKIMYRSTMNPNEVSDHPGKDSMGMEMVPFEVEEAAPSGVSGRAAVKISSERQQLIGVTSALVSVQAIHKRVKAVGRVDYAEPNISLVTLKFEGYIEKLIVNSTGRLVKRGDPLFEIYSPDLVSAQEEYLLALKAKNLPGGAGLSVLNSAREKLRLWDITDRQVEDLERSGKIQRTLMIFAPISGFVIEKNVLAGQKVMPGESLYKIADLSTVWVIGDVYEYELPFIKTGQEARLALAAFPGETFKGKVTYIYPYLNAATRTNSIRIEVLNPGFKVKPAMFANVEIDVDYGARLAVPADAVLNAGLRTFAFVDKGNGYFEPRELTLGVKGENFIEVLSGVTSGERVVTSANFLIDSESSLKAALQALTQPPPGGAAGEPKHD